MIDRGRFDSSKDVLAELARSADDGGTDLNEATTRHHYVDRLLHEVLAWPTAKVSCEDAVVDGGFTDYLLGAPSRLAVLEAKKQGVYFRLPAGLADAKSISLETFTQAGADNRSAFDQVTRYCLQTGIQIAVLCNGHQLLAFLATRTDGTPPIKGRAVLFGSLDAMLARHIELWDFLSEPGLLAGHLRKTLSRGPGAISPPERLSARIQGYPGLRHKTSLETDLGNLASVFIVDLMNDREVTDEFIRECYCVSGALSQHSAVSKQILRQRYDHSVLAANIQPVRDKRGVDTGLGPEAIAAAMTRRPIVLIGDVGVGKTFFLRHLIRVEAASVLTSANVVYVDFLEESDLLRDVSLFVIKKFEEALVGIGVAPRADETARKIYKPELRQFAEGIYSRLKDADPAAYLQKELALLEELMSDPVEHVKRLLNLVRAERSQDFMLVLDNIDHHPTTLQEQVFILGQSLAQKWGIAVFISLRPDTFHASKKAGSLAAFQPKVFSVSPPRVDQVIDRRLRFAYKQLLETGRLDSFPQGFTINSENLVSYLDVLIEAFTKRRDLIELIDNMASGNVRLALDLISQFVGSGYVAIRRILEIASQGRRYTMPMHELIRALMYGDGEFYDPRSSAIPNILDIETNDATEHFLTPTLLTHCETDADVRHESFVQLSRLHDLTARIGYTPEQTTNHLARALEKGLVQSRSLQGEEYRITQAGAYMRKMMLPRFAYLDGISVDIPITDPSARANITVVSTVQDRAERVSKLLDYLDACWVPIAGGTRFNWMDASLAARNDVTAVLERANR